MSLQTLAIIGAGPAGRSLALRCASSGVDVVMEDVMPSNLRRAQDEYAELRIDRGTGSLRLASTIEDAVRDADIVIDFVPDELESKLEIVSLIDRMAPPRTIVCIPSRTLSITDLASCTYRASNCVALRGAATNVVESPLELVRGRLTSPATLLKVSVLLTRVGIAFSIADDLAPMLVKNLGG